MNGSTGAEFVNRAYMEFVGVSRQTDVTHWTRYVHPDDRDGYVNAYLKTVERRGTFDTPFRFRRHDGELHGYVGASFDMTDSKEAEAQLRSLSSQLERLVEERTEELVQSKDLFAGTRDGAESETRVLPRGQSPARCLYCCPFENG
jgi:hypothetical protein